MHADFAAKHRGQTAHDGKPEPGPAVLAAGRTVDLLESLEDALQFFGRNADAGVGDHQTYERRNRAKQALLTHRLGAQSYATAGGELECIADQVHQDLSQFVRVGLQAFRRLGGDVDIEIEPALTRDMLVLALEPGGEQRQVDGISDHLHLAGLDLRQIENVVDELQQIGSAFEHDSGGFDLVFAEVAFVVVGQGLGEYQQAVERRTQLVRHVRQKFRLVLAGLFQVLVALLEFPPEALQLLVEFAQRTALLLQFLVGRLQFLLLHPQFLFGRA